MLLELPNPEYQNLQNNHQDLKTIKNVIKKREPFVNDYAKIKTLERSRVGFPGEPIAELTKLGWVISSPGKKTLQLISCLLKRLCITMKTYVV